MTSEPDLSDESKGIDDYEFEIPDVNLNGEIINYLLCSMSSYLYFMVLFILFFIDYLLLAQHNDDDKIHEPEH